MSAVQQLQADSTHSACRITSLCEEQSQLYVHACEVLGMDLSSSQCLLAPAALESFIASSSQVLPSPELASRACSTGLLELSSSTQQPAQTARKQSKVAYEAGCVLGFPRRQTAHHVCNKLQAIQPAI